ncbi:MAG: hypothetical protein EGQ34_06775 [Sutterella sp.]|nr:hypothetical protein [Sutterella sp.]
MTFSFDWILAGLVFVLANLYLGMQLVRLIWPLRALKLSARLRKEAVDASSWLSLAADEFEVRSAIPVKLVVFLLQRGDLEDPAELRCRSLWRRGWIYTILTLILFYAQPYLFGTSMDSLSLTLVLCQSLAAFAQALLIQSIADFRRLRVLRYLDQKDRMRREKEMKDESPDASHDQDALK